jgi:hypothetical protein
MVDPDRVGRLLVLLERYRSLLAEDAPDPTAGGIWSTMSASPEPCAMVGSTTSARSPPRSPRSPKAREW